MLSTLSQLVFHLGVFSSDGDKVAGIKLYCRARQAVLAERHNGAILIGSGENARNRREDGDNERYGQY